MRFLVCCTVPLFYCVVIAAQPAPKKANVIEVSPVSLREVVSHLTSSGWIPQSIDTTFGIIRTEQKALKKINGYMALRIIIKDSTAEISGVTGDNITMNLGSVAAGPSSQEVQNKGMKGSQMRIAFDAMDDFARSLGGRVEYRVR